MSYINKEALLDRLTQIAEAAENPAYLIAMRTAMAEIACALEEDVVKVVRCKECAHSKPVDLATSHLFGKTRTANTRVCRMINQYRSVDYYCASGEPKEGAE